MVATESASNQCCAYITIYKETNIQSAGLTHTQRPLLVVVGGNRFFWEGRVHRGGETHLLSINNKRVLQWTWCAARNPAVLHCEATACKSLRASSGKEEEEEEEEEEERLFKADAVNEEDSEREEGVRREKKGLVTKSVRECVLFIGTPSVTLALSAFTRIE